MERNWRKLLNSFFIPNLHRLTLVIDQDGLLSDERMVKDLGDQGFRVLLVRDLLQLRYEYELVRERWDAGQKQEELLLVCNPALIEEQSIPYDILSSAHRIELSLELLFPKLYQPSLRNLDKRYFDTLLVGVEEEAIDSPMNERWTNLFLLRFLFRIHGNELQTDLDIFRMLIRLHYNRITLPAFLVLFLERYLNAKTYLVDWHLYDLLSSSELFWNYVQEVWEVSVTGQLKYALVGPSKLPFSHSDILVYLDNAFREGLLQPLRIERVDIKGVLPENLLEVGTTQGSESELALERIQKLLVQIPAHLPKEDSFYTEWMDFQRFYAQVVKLEALYCTDKGQLEEIQLLRRECNEKFASWMEKHFDSLMFEHGRTPVLVSQIHPFLAEKAGEYQKIALVVLDGLSFSQWLTLKILLEKELSDFVFEEQGCFAWIPSLTSVSRQSIFAGMPPRYFGQTLDSTRAEERLWVSAWKKERPTMDLREVRYYKGLGKGSVEVDLAQIPYSTKYLGLVVNSIDDIMHGMILGELGMQESIQTWMKTKYLVGLLQGLVLKGFEIWLTSDHGNIEAMGIGAINEGVLAESRGQRVRTYATSTLRDATVKQHQDLCKVWDSTTLPEGYQVALASGNGAFVNKGERIVSHGGLSLEEVIVPFVRVIRKQHE